MQENRSTTSGGGCIWEGNINVPLHQEKQNLRITIVTRRFCLLYLVLTKKMQRSGSHLNRRSAQWARFREEAQQNKRALTFEKKPEQASYRLLRRGAEGGIRTPARFYPPTPLAGEPLIATWVLLHGCK